jgi:hypothetical protein
MTLVSILSRNSLKLRRSVMWHHEPALRRRFPGVAPWLIGGSTQATLITAEPKTAPQDTSLNSIPSTGKC